MRNRILAASTVAMLGLGSFPVTALAADTTTTSESTEASTATKVTPTGHKPGNVGFGVDLPKNLTYTTTDGKQVPHPCAGRKMAYQSHNDALYATRDARVDGNPLSVMAVDGQQVTPMDELCFRLAPDADQEGNEVSRLVIGDGLEFIGDKGDTVWFAPQETNFMQQWRPLWSGLGAFDPAHELDGNVPKGSTAYFDMADISAPEGGAVHIFRDHLGKIDRYFSSDNKDMRTIEYKAGAHGHFNWAFTEPGIYKITWKVRLKSPDGKVEESKPVDQYWLVGDDPTVGLKEGTTENLNKIEKTVEEQAGGTTSSPSTSAPNDGAGDLAPGLMPAPGPKFDPNAPAKPSETPTTAPAVPSEPVKPGDATASETQQPSDPAVVPPAPGTSEVCTPVDALATKPTAFIKSGHMDLALQGPKGEINARLHDDSDPSKPVERESGTFLFEVADSAKTAIPEQYKDTFLGKSENWWILPQGQVDGLPWLGFSTTGLNAESLAPDSTVSVKMKDVVGPGDIVTWHESLASVRKELDSRDPESSLTYDSNAHDHQSFGFSEPGLYAATFVYTGKAADGSDFSEELRASFAVGQEAIAEARGHKENNYADLPTGQECAVSGQDQGTNSKGESRPQWDRLINAVEGIGRDVAQIGSLLGGKTEPAPANPEDPVSPADPVPSVDPTDSVPAATESPAAQSPQWEAFLRASGSLTSQALGHAPLFEWYFELKLVQQLANSVVGISDTDAGSDAASDGSVLDAQGGTDPEGDASADAPEDGASQGAAADEPGESPAVGDAPAGGAGAGNAPANNAVAPASAPAPGQPASGGSSVSAGSSVSGQAGSPSPAAVAQAGSTSSGSDSSGDSDDSSAESVEQAETGDEVVPDAEPLAEGEDAVTGGGVVSSIDGQQPGPKQYDAASQGRTAGGFWAGLAFGFGAMALIGGGVLFSAAWKALRDVNGVNADLAGKRSSR